MQILSNFLYRTIKTKPSWRQGFTVSGNDLNDNAFRFWFLLFQKYVSVYYAVKFRFERRKILIAHFAYIIIAVFSCYFVNILKNTNWKYCFAFWIANKNRPEKNYERSKRWQNRYFNRHAQIAVKRCGI